MSNAEIPWRWLEVIQPSSNLNNPTIIKSDFSIMQGFWKSELQVHIKVSQTGFQFVEFM